MSKIQEALRQISTSHQRNVESITRSAQEMQLMQPGAAGRRMPELLQDLVRGKPPVRADLEEFRKEKLLVPQDDWKLLASQLREIKRPLLAHAFGKRAVKVPDGNMVMITSAMAGEGKTFISLHLALSITHEPDHSVILIDGDVLKPRLTHAFGASDRKGLLDYLDDPTMDVGSIVYPTTIPGLSFLPAGGHRINSTELLSGSRMEELMHHLRRHAEGHMVIFDAPPVLETTESKVIAGLAGQIVLVVHAEKTPQSAVIAAASVLDSSGPLNLLLNQMGSRAFQSTYAYGMVYPEDLETADDGSTDAAIQITNDT